MSEKCVCDEKTDYQVKKEKVEALKKRLDDAVANADPLEATLALLELQIMGLQEKKPPPEEEIKKLEIKLKILEFEKKVRDSKKSDAPLAGREGTSGKKGDRARTQKRNGVKKDCCGKPGARG